MIGSYGGHLLEWLNRYTFPTERKFEDPEHARRVARAFYDELLRNGTLCALIFSTIHREATDIFFEEAERRGFRGIIGKTMMDRNAPDYLLDAAAAVVRRQPRAAREMARTRSAALRDHAALRADVDARAARIRRAAQARVSRRLGAHAHLREPQRSALGAGALPRGRVRGRVRPLRPAQRAHRARARRVAHAGGARSARRAAARASRTVRTRTSSSAAVSFRCTASSTPA